MSEYSKDEYYILFDSIQIKNDVTELVVEVSREMDDLRYVEEEFNEEEDYLDEYSFFIQGKEIIRITDKFVVENPGYFK
ncbi:hypothetical protein [Polaribacter porphyrae]|uniref:hypothetical protein n=1 Tax=Polaribacter porphyrae TaxID=1137780 RepID=UPI0011AFE2F5|nr:hypothetical protein [Polaribacter porphyrae]